jgi:16S rRNA processing protein RimM
MKKQFLEAGKIVAVQGLKGEIRAEVWCDSPEFLCAFKSLYFDGGREKLEIERSRPHKGTLAVIKIKGIDTPEDAAKIRGKILFINRDDAKLDENSYFIQDLLGMKVMDADSGEDYGEIIEVSATGANDVYHIKKGERVVLVPAIPDVVVKTDVDSGEMLIRPLKGLFDDED